LLFLFAVIAVIFFGSRIALSLWVDLLWFKSLGYGDVFWKSRGLQWGIFLGFAIITFLVLYGAFSALKRAHRDDLPSDHTIFISGQPIKLSVEPVLRVLAVGVSIVVALVTGAAMQAQWSTLALYWYAPSSSGSIVDPIFGRPLSFYLFTLPAWQLMAGWLLTMAVLICIMAVVFLVISGGSRALEGRFNLHSPLPWRGLSFSVAFLFSVLAMRAYIGRFEQLFEHHTIFDGVTYTDAHVTLAGMLFVAVMLLLGAFIALAGAVWSPRGRWLLASVVPAVLCYSAVGVRLVRQRLSRQAQ